MLETEAGSGTYEKSTSSSWPGEDYIFNENLSACENGGKLSWDEEKKAVILNSFGSDACYVYFDKKITLADVCSNGDNLSECIINYYNETGDMDNGLYHHDTDLANGAADNSYRYAGANPNNYVCFDDDCSDEDNLYRIIGVFASEVKLIKSTSYGNYVWESDYDTQGNTWNSSTKPDIRSTLNTTFLNTLSSTWQNKIATHAYKVGGMSYSSSYTAKNYYDREVGSSSSSTTDSMKIGLMYVSDYGYAASNSYWTEALNNYDGGAQNNNWMYLGDSTEWTISRSSDNSSDAFRVYSTGNVGCYHVNLTDAVRPSFYLKENVTYISGDGSKENPIQIDYKQTLADYVISQYTGVDGDNGLYYHDADLANGAGDNSYRYAGANPNNYVCFGSDAASCPSDNLYRIIGVFENEVKLIKADYPTTSQIGTGGAYVQTYGSWDSSTYYKGSQSLSSIGSYYWNSSGSNTWSESDLNTTNLNDTYLNSLGSVWGNKIASHTWYVGGHATSSATPKEFYNAESSGTTWSGKIGLMYVSDYGYAASNSAWTSDVYDYDSSTIKNNNWMYMGLYEWTIFRFSSGSHDAFRVYEFGVVNYGDVLSSSFAVRPCFYLTSTTEYLSGFGTQTDPIIIN